MSVGPLDPRASVMANLRPGPRPVDARLTSEAGGQDEKLRETFHQMMGETLFRMAIKQMRSSVGSGGLFDSGATSEIMFGMFDEHVASLMAKVQPRGFSDRYFQQFRQMREQGATNQAEKHQL
jgi:Rod binding domain-containing protein